MNELENLAVRFQIIIHSNYFRSFCLPCGSLPMSETTRVLVCWVVFGFLAVSCLLPVMPRIKNHVALASWSPLLPKTWWYSLVCTILAKLCTTSTSKNWKHYWYFYILVLLLLQRTQRNLSKKNWSWFTFRNKRRKKKRPLKKMSDDGDCCLNSPCCEKCANCCCCDDSNKKKTPEEERREQERLQIYMRSAVYIGYLFATIGFFTLDHFAWHYNIFMIVFWILFMTSFTSYEMLRTSNPGYLKHLPAPASKSQAVKKDTLVPENTAVKRRNTNTAEGIIMMNDEFEPTQRTEADCGEDPSEDGVVRNLCLSNIYIRLYNATSFVKNVATTLPNMITIVFG